MDPDPDPLGQRQSYSLPEQRMIRVVFYGLDRDNGLQHSSKVAHLGPAILPCSDPSLQWASLPPPWAGAVTGIPNITSSAFADPTGAPIPLSDSFYGMKSLIYLLDFGASRHMTGRIDFFN
ncbi:hypothetical protein M9H77_18025 [Catharanthus roseus]|uniref:Uncharacterized protein n=1 Tax=Catharanthus roseus TaxID=4058 RepID=A0ACC0B6B4_CATRO|nr:hypothetical protein M9H77_18025 [Catharanthus roseus]